MRRWPLGFLLAMVVMCVAAFPADKVTLRLTLQEGDSFRFKVVVDQVINQTVLGQEQPMTQQIGMGQQFNVVHAQDDVYTIEMSYYWVAFEQEGPFGLITYDSNNPPDTLHPMVFGFAVLKGQRVTMKIDALGHILDIEGIEAMLDAMTTQFESLGIAPSPDIRASLKQQFGDAMMKSQVENMLAIYPQEAVGVGDAWTKEVVLQAGMPMRLTNTYRLVAREEGKAHIAVESTVAPGDGEPMLMDGVTLAYTMSGTQQGTMWLDEANGMPLQVDLNQHLTGEVSMNGSMTWPIEIQTRNVMEAER